MREITHRGMAVAAIIFTAMSPVTAMTVKQYREWKGKKETQPLAALYVNAVGETYSWANVDLDRSKQPKLFCAPAKLAMTAQNYENMLEDGIKFAPQRATAQELSDLPIELILLHTLEETFPCPEK